MAHFAKIDENTREVLQVLHVNNSDIVDSNGVEQEIIGQQYLETHNNWPADLWIKTSYNTENNTHKENGTPFRGNYAGIGYIWDQENQIFWPPKPFGSWVKNTSEARWQSPIGDPPAFTQEQLDQNAQYTHLWVYNWDEVNNSWNLTNEKA